MTPADIAIAVDRDLARYEETGETTPLLELAHLAVKYRRARNAHAEAVAGITAIRGRVGGRVHELARKAVAVDDELRIATLSIEIQAALPERHDLGDPDWKQRVLDRIEADARRDAVDRARCERRWYRRLWRWIRGR